MAQFLYDRDSTGKHVNAARRHSRLSHRQNKGEYSELIKPPLDAVLEKAKVTEEKNELRENAHDDLLLADSHLDDSVRDTFAAAQSHDRANPAAAVINRIFPGAKFGDIVNTPVTQEPDVVEQLAIRIEALGEAHPMFPQAAVLREKITASRAAIIAYQDAIRNVKFAEAEEEIALANLRRQYEANYLNCRKDYGKVLAERLFPRLRKSASDAVMEAA